jgi:hypothetical protein
MHWRFATATMPFAGVLATILLSNSSKADDRAPKMRFSAATPADAHRWNNDCRKLVFDLLKLTDLQKTRAAAAKEIPFDAKVLSTEEREGYVWKEIEFNSTPTRRIKAVVTVPKSADEKSQKKHPAVVCIHGHGGERKIVYDPKSLYSGFATKLAEDGYVTISTDVGQHKVYEEGRTLMGERLWDVLRAADYLTTRPEVDAERLGCGGLSLGGEMAMWLGAMDPRMKVTVSSGFLTTMSGIDNDSCCLCWKFPGLTENFEFCDIYSMIAPRGLTCQNGEKERAPGGFPIDVAKPAMAEIERAYAVFDSKKNAVLDIHPGGHVYVVPTAHAFMDRFLK